MGEIYPDLAGAYKRSVGNTVYYIRFGANLARRKPVPNENRKSSDEQLKRQRQFAVINVLGRKVKGVVDVGFPQRPRKWSGVNMFVHVNTGVWQESGDEVAVDFSKLVLADGFLIEPEVEVALNYEEGTLVFNAGAAEEEIDAQPDDRVMGVIIDAKNGFCRMRELFTRGAGGKYSFSLPQRWDMEALQVYVFALSRDGKQASRSHHLPVGG